MHIHAISGDSISSSFFAFSLIFFKVYVFGDIHGNLEDLHFFSDNLWKLGMDLTAGELPTIVPIVDVSC